MKAYLQTKMGEIEGRVSFVEMGGSGRVFVMFNAPDLSLNGHTKDSQRKALNDFEKHFGRIVREDG